MIVRQRPSVLRRSEIVVLAVELHGRVHPDHLVCSVNRQAALEKRVRAPRNVGDVGKQTPEIGQWNAGIPSGSMLRIPRSHFEETSAAIRQHSRESAMESSRFVKLSPFSFCQCSQRVSAVVNSARLPKRVTASGRQSTVSMSLSAHSLQVPARLSHVRFAMSCGKLVSGGNTGSVHDVSLGLSPPRMIMRTVTEGRAVVSASSISTALLLGLS